MFQEWVKQADTQESSDGCSRSIEEGGAVVVDDRPYVNTPKDLAFQSHHSRTAIQDDAASCDAVVNAENDDTTARWFTFSWCRFKSGTPNNTSFFEILRRNRRGLIACATLLAFCLLVGVTVPFAGESSSSSSTDNSSSSTLSSEDNGDRDNGDGSGKDLCGFDFTAVNSTTTSPTTGGDRDTFPTATSSNTTTSVAPQIVPSAAPTIARTSSPSSTVSPSSMPSLVPTSSPTTPIPPVAAPPILPLVSNSSTLLTFCVIADVPYDRSELRALPDQIATQMEGCEFLVHLGDLFDGDTTCEEQSYHDVRDIMLASEVPTFVVLGDNEWNDCVRDRIDAGWELWNQEFLRFENRWNHTMTVVRQPGFEENFYFIEKRTLIIGLNLVGGRVHNQTEWKTRQETEYAWTRDVINTFVPQFADGVIIMAHAKPSTDQRFFMDPLRDDMASTWQNKFPILYLHGDGHSWVYAPHFKQQPNMLRVQHEGGVRDPILKVLADPTRNGPDVYSSFQFDRQLDLQ